MMRHGFIAEPGKRRHQHQILFQQLPRLAGTQAFGRLLDALLQTIQQAPAIVAQMVAYRAAGSQQAIEQRLHAAGVLRIGDQVEQFLAQCEEPRARRFRHRRHRDLQGVEQVVQTALVGIVLLPFQQPPECFAQQPRGAVEPFEVAPHPVQVIGNPAGQIAAIASHHDRAVGLPQQADMTLRCRRQHPPVLADTAVLQRSLQRIQAGRDSGQSAGHDAITVAVGDHETAQDHRSRRQSALFQHRRGGQRQRLLTDKAIGVGANSPDQLRAGRRVELAAVPARPVRQDRAHHQAVQIRQYVTAFGRVAAPPGGRGWQFEILAQQMPAQHRQESGQSRVFDEAATQGIGQRDMTTTHCL